MNWYLKVLKQYSDFNGRARRMEYWMFNLMNTAIVCLICVGFVLTDNEVVLGISGVLMAIYLIAIMIPSLAVAVRRMHDIGRSGWFVLIQFIPFVGGIIFLIFTLIEGDQGTNQYGPDPKAQPLEDLIEEIGR